MLRNTATFGGVLMVRPYPVNMYRPILLQPHFSSGGETFLLFSRQIIRHGTVSATQHDHRVYISHTLMAC